MKRLTIPALLVALLLPTAIQARWIQDKVEMQVEATGAVEFSHYNHLEAVGKNCPSCHNGIYNILPAKNPDFTMKQMEEGKACGACHNGTKAFSVKSDCSNCHPTREIAIANPSAPAQFSHDVHTGMYGCGECHPGLFVPDVSRHQAVTMKQMGDGEACGACHDGSTAFSVAENCSSCHPTAELKIENDGGVVAFSHEVHTGMYGCGECHPDLFVPDMKKNPAVSMEQMSEGVACGACHDGSTAFTVEENCETCHEM